MKWFIFYLIAVNFFGLWIMGEDKRRAQMHRWRIRESVLFITALVGGSLGTVLGMQLFRHKTKHWYFQLGMPAILIAQILLWLRWR